MKVTMDYGRDGLDIEVPDHAHVLQMSDAPALSDLDQKLEEALAHPIGALALRLVARAPPVAVVALQRGPLLLRLLERRDRAQLRLDVGRLVLRGGELRAHPLRR